MAPVARQMQVTVDLAAGERGAVGDHCVGELVADDRVPATTALRAARLGGVDEQWPRCPNSGWQHQVGQTSTRSAPSTVRRLAGVGARPVIMTAESRAMV
jgi:hypothetical protein